MGSNPLEQAIESGVNANEQIGVYFARLGTGEHTRGIIPSIYRKGKRDIAAALQAGNRPLAVRDVLSSMRFELQSGLSSLIDDAHAFGQEEALRQLGFYGADIRSPSMGLSTQSQRNEVAAILAVFDQQAASVIALVATDAPEDLILGDEDRAGILRTGTLLSAGAFWAARAVWDAWMLQVQQQDRLDYDFKKQVVAALDNHTTQCCLLAHAQIKPVNNDFELKGEPRFADKMDWTPFHYYCRSSVVLYLKQFDDGLTARMRAGADQIIYERKHGIYKDRWPVDAYG